MPEPSHCSAPAEWGALVETLDAVSVVVERTTDDTGGDRHRAALFVLVLVRLPGMPCGDVAMSAGTVVVVVLAVVVALTFTLGVLVGRRAATAGPVLAQPGRAAGAR